MVERGQPVAPHADVRTLVCGAVVAAAFATLAACAGDTDAAPSPMTPPPVASESATTDAPVTKPERPAAMDRKGPKGAAAAAEYFIELYPYVMATGDTAEFESMSHEACGFCSDALEQAESIRENGDRWIGGEVSMDIARIYDRDALTGVLPLDVEIDQAAGKIIDVEGETLFAQDRSVDVYRAEMGFRNGAWQVVELVLQGDGE
ncbi:hypothetical protein GCM10028784_38660 [Myceligenerans cantabricum]